VHQSRVILLFHSHCSVVLGGTSAAKIPSLRGPTGFGDLGGKNTTTASPFIIGTVNMISRLSVVRRKSVQDDSTKLHRGRNHVSNSILLQKAAALVLVCVLVKTESVLHRSPESLPAIIAYQGALLLLPEKSFSSESYRRPILTLKQDIRIRGRRQDGLIA